MVQSAGLLLVFGGMCFAVGLFFLNRRCVKLIACNLADIINGSKRSNSGYYRNPSIAKAFQSTSEPRPLKPPHGSNSPCPLSTSSAASPRP